MTDATTNLDFNTAGTQKEPIPAGTIVGLLLTVRPGGSGPGGVLRRSADGGSEGLDCEFTVLDEGPYAKRKLWQLFTLGGTTPGHAEAGEISRITLRAIIESARDIRPDDKSATAEAARHVSSLGDFNGMRFIARIGVKPPRDGFAAKNVLQEIITPERQAWRKLEQTPAAPIANASNPPATETPANAIGRPQWAERS